MTFALILCPSLPVFILECLHETILSHIGSQWLNVPKFNHPSPCVHRNKLCYVVTCTILCFFFAWNIVTAIDSIWESNLHLLNVPQIYLCPCVADCYCDTLLHWYIVTTLIHCSTTAEQVTVHSGGAHWDTWNLRLQYILYISIYCFSFVLWHGMSEQCWGYLSIYLCKLCERKHCLIEFCVMTWHEWAVLGIIA